MPTANHMVIKLDDGREYTIYPNWYPEYADIENQDGEAVTGDSLRDQVIVPALRLLQAVSINYGSQDDFDKAVEHAVQYPVADPEPSPS